MTTVTIEEAQQKLGELIDHLAGTRPVARLERESAAGIARRTPGSARGRLTVLVEDDEHLRDFEDRLE